MQTLQQSCRGLGVIVRLNMDMVLASGTLVAALAAAAWMATV